MGFSTDLSRCTRWGWVPLLVCLAATAAAQPGRLPAPVPYTPAEARLAAHARHDALEAASWVADLPLRNVGPTVMSGRVTDLDVWPQDPTHFFVAYASGGLWKTTSSGASFTPVFDHEATMTLGDIAVRWPATPGGMPELWVGTGENNASRSSYAGTGLYRSTDGGQTWQHLGLAETHHIGRIVLHPTDPQTAWVAALGHLYSPHPERGVFKTTDGGQTWRKTLFIGPDTGVIDVLIDPTNPQTLYAASWYRTRRAWNFEESGPGSGLFKSTDGGETWQPLAGAGSGFPQGPGVGRIGLDVYPGNPNWLYAVVDVQDRRPEKDSTATDSLALTKARLQTMTAAQFEALSDSLIHAFLDQNGFPLNYDAATLKAQISEGRLRPVALVEYLEDANTQLFDTPVTGAMVYRSQDGGATWRQANQDFIDDFFFTYGYYFGQLRVAPTDPERLYLLGVPLIASADGGQTWAAIDADHVHVDHHALWVNPARPGHLVSGNDGGVNLSFDDGKSWTKANTPAVGQFYTVAVDQATPYRVYGGLQDNGVWRGPSTYEANPGWVAYGRYPYEELLGGDGMQIQIDPRDNETIYAGYQFGNYFRIDGRTGERTDIQPKHDLGERPLRFNWQSPIHLSRHNPDILYFGSNKLHRSLNQGTDWATISPDLTHGGVPGDVPYGTLTSIHESPLRFGLLAVGSDDGRVHVSRDGGVTWQDVSKGLPERLWVSRIRLSAHAETRLFVTLNGYRWDHFDAYVYRSDDLGQTWTRLGRDLPMEPVNALAEDPVNPDLLFVGTDQGLYVSLDRGASFVAMEGGASGQRLPNAPVHDLVIHPTEPDLVIGTHGRSIYIAYLEHLRELTPAKLRAPLHVFPSKPVTHRAQWGRRGWSWQPPKPPTTRLAYIVPDTATVTITLSTEAGQPLYTLADRAARGLNYVDLPLRSTVPAADDQRPAEDGFYYLVPGAYVVTVADGRSRVQHPLHVEPGPPPPARGRKKTP